MQSSSSSTTTTWLNNEKKNSKCHQNEENKNQITSKLIIQTNKQTIHTYTDRQIR